MLTLRITAQNTFIATLPGASILLESSCHADEKSSFETSKFLLIFRVVATHSLYTQPRKLYDGVVFCSCIYILYK